MNNPPPSSGSHAAECAPTHETTDTIRIRRGTMRDYDALAHWHTRAGRPARPTMVLCAHDAASPRECLGVLVVAWPILNAWWRPHAWPGTFGSDHPGSFNSLGKRAQARLINARVRCIARVIVEPGARGRGFASALVRECLHLHSSMLIETVACMARFHGLFESCGMRAVRPPRSSWRERTRHGRTRVGRPKQSRTRCQGRDARLRVVLLKELARTERTPAALVDLDAGERLLRRTPVRRALRQWADAASSTRKAPINPNLLCIAAAKLTSPPGVWAWEGNS